eukprot:gene162-biopygen44
MPRRRVKIVPMRLRGSKNNSAPRQHPVAPSGTAPTRRRSRTNQVLQYVTICARLPQISKGPAQRRNTPANGRSPPQEALRKNRRSRGQGPSGDVMADCNVGGLNTD